MSQSPSPPRRGRFRFLYQFSLRTLLLVTAAVAVFCNWYFQPKYHEEELAGKELRLRRQIKLKRADSDTTKRQPGFPPWSPSFDPNILNHGNWSLRDGNDLTLARGRFIENQATGNWTAWYPTGGKAAEGKMQQGVKVGRWRTWYEDGTPASEILFSDQPVKRTDFIPNRPPTGGFGNPNQEYDLAPYRPVASSREGPTTAWHKSGKLKYEGVFARDQQDGAWTFYDVQGRITETGPFRAGQRHGQWAFYDSPGAKRSLRYIDGRTEAELEQLLARLKTMLASDHRRERYAALIDLADLGEGAAPLLLERLTHGDAHEQAAIVGMLPRMPTGVQLVVPRVRELVASSDPRIAHQARLTLFQLDSECWSKLFEPLLAEAIAAPTLGLCLEELTVLYRFDESRRGEVFAALMALPTTRDDPEVFEIATAAAELGGDVTPYLLAACEHEQAIVRLQAARTLERLLAPWGSRPSFIRLEEKDRQSLVARLKNDPSTDVRQAAEDMDRRPPPSGFGAGFF